MDISIVTTVTKYCLLKDTTTLNFGFALASGAFNHDSQYFFNPMDLEMLM